MTRLTLFVLVTCALSGCAQYAQVQIDLTEQARRGVALAGEYQSSLREREAQLSMMRRERLNDGFDADVRERALAPEGLSPEWVIEHRRAYVAALDVFAADEQASAQAAETAPRNLEAIDAALARLQWLQSLQLRLPWINEETQP